MNKIIYKFNNKHKFKAVEIKFVLFLLFALSQALNSQWISKYQGHNTGDNSLDNARGSSISADNTGYCYVTGFVDDYNGQGKNVLVIKYNSQNGDTVWVETFNGAANGDDQGYKVAVDNNYNVYVAGTVSNVTGTYEAILLKYDSEGTLIWNRPYYLDSLRSDAKALGLVIDHNNDIYVTGYCTNADSVAAMMTLKYDTAGTVLWHKEEFGSDYLGAEACAIKLSNDGSKVFVLGFINNLGTQSDIVLIGYNSLYGTEDFVYSYNGTGNGEDRAFGIAVDETDNIHIAGYTTADSTGNNDCITIKYSSSNNDTLWVRTYNGTGNGEDRAFGIAVDADGNVYITGTTTTILGAKDYLILGYTSSGDLLWTDPMTYNGTGNGNDVASAIGIVKNQDTTESIIVTGSSINTNNNNDYVTIMLDAATGDSQVVDIYTMNSLTDDVAKDIAVDSSNNAYVTGFSQLLGNGPAPQSVVSTLKISRYKGSHQVAKNNTPSGFRLSQNFPNPFNPSTTIKFDIPKSANVKLTVYDILGRTVSVLINQYLNAGSYNMKFTFSDLASGIYFYELKAGNFRDVKKMSLIK